MHCLKQPVVYTYTLREVKAVVIHCMMMGTDEEEKNQSISVNQFTLVIFYKSESIQSSKKFSTSLITIETSERNWILQLSWLKTPVNGLAHRAWKYCHLFYWESILNRELIDRDTKNRNWIKWRDSQTLPPVKTGAFLCSNGGRRFESCW